MSAMYPIKAHNGIFYRSGNGPFFLHSWCNMARQMSAKLPLRRGDRSLGNHTDHQHAWEMEVMAERASANCDSINEAEEKGSKTLQEGHTLSPSIIYIYISERVYICFPVYTSTYLGYSSQLTMIPAASHFNSQPTLHIHPSLKEAFLLILSPSLGSLMHS